MPRRQWSPLWSRPSVANGEKGRDVMSAGKANRSWRLGGWVVTLSLLLVLAVGVQTSTAASTTFYVGLTNCSDAGPGTQTNPWCTINHATQTMVAGNTTYVMTGTYVESASFAH